MELKLDTSQSILKSAKASLRSEAWFKLFNIYEPLIAGWIARAGVEEAAVSDLTQEVLQVVSVELPKFEHNGRRGAFRSWLKQISIFRCRRYWDSKKRQVKLEQISSTDLGTEVLNQLEDPNSELSKLWDIEHDQYVLRRILELTKSEFSVRTFEVFTRNTLNAESANSISEDLGISVGQIYKIKHRVLSRLEQVARGLVDDIEFRPNG